MAGERRLQPRRLGADRDPLVVAAAVHEHPMVLWAEPDKLSGIRPAGVIPSDQYYSKQYYLKNDTTLNGIPVDVNVENVWPVTKGSSGIAVAVIGTGIDGAHPEISGRRKTGVCYDGWDEALQEPYYTGSAWEPRGEYCPNWPQGPCGDIDDEHETAVAGIIAADHNSGTVAGIAPNVMLVSARIMAQGGAAHGTDEDIAAAITWAWQTCGADVVNGSFVAAAPSTAIAEAIQDGAVEGRRMVEYALA